MVKLLLKSSLLCEEVLTYTLSALEGFQRLEAMLLAEGFHSLFVLLYHLQLNLLYLLLGFFDLDHNLLILSFGLLQSALKHLNFLFFNFHAYLYFANALINDVYLLLELD